MIKQDYKVKNRLSWKDTLLDPMYPELCCSDHKHNFAPLKPFLIIVYRENTSKTAFNKYIFSSNIEHIQDSFERDCFKYSLRKQNATKNDDVFKKLNLKNAEICLSQVYPQDFQDSVEEDAMSKFLTTICQPDWANTTFISQDLHSVIAVSKVFL
jgi:hypothetical protein